ncbi:MAG: hypothetical protein H0W27_01290 [Actinobacteria bacterium]|nr:hypothetical protein [Actinomycetota bacterium]
MPSSIRPEIMLKMAVQVSARTSSGEGPSGSSRSIACRKASTPRSLSPEKK